MSAIVKTRPISLKFRAFTPKRVIHEIKKKYSDYVIEDKQKSSIDDRITWKETALHRKISKDLTPGLVIREMRDVHGMTQKKLAEKIGTAATRVSDWETGQRDISKEYAKRLAEIFKMSPADFI